MAEQSKPEAQPVIGVHVPSDGDDADPNWGDGLVLCIGNAIAWLFPALVVAIVAQILLRGMGKNQAWLDDLQWWMYGVAGLTGFAYAIATNSHVRVDIFYNRFDERKKARIDAFGLAWLLLPFIMLMTDVMTHYAVASWLAREGSDSPNGLHGLYLLKTTLPMLFALAGVAAWSRYYRNLRKLTEPTVYKQLLFALPATWFMAERIVYYVLWWYVRFTQPELNPRRIPKQDILDHTMWIGLALLASVVAIAYFLSRRRARPSSNPA